MRKFKALKDEWGMDDLGASGITFETKSLIKDHIYSEVDTKHWDEAARNSDPFIVDETGCCRDIKHLLKLGLIHEI